MGTKRQRGRRHIRRREASRRRRRECLYCRSTENEFVGEEHVVPFALGGRDDVLPPGVVCRPCNNGPLSRLDSQLADFGPIAIMRVQLDLRGRSGNPPAARFSNAHIIRLEGNRIVVDVQSGKRTLVEDPEIKNKFRLSVEGRRMTPDYARTLVRSLYKILLGFVWLDHGRDFAMREGFDEARRMVLGTQDFSGYLAMLRNAQPSVEASFTYQWVEVGGTPTVAVMADFYGIRLLTDLDSRRVMEPDKVPRDEISLIEF